ncbi:putative thermostable alkaline protease [Rosellinia necatrix]|uniref:Putative thermostable alkaline protease n=1 Tax=Rosellinia necatrix TaxID=77044 RepID=A0A1S8A6N0_ROSNE|nr:putative thermostable alkaline protease [Rosellinia necatrix]
MSYITLHRSSTIDSTSHASHSQLNEDVFAILSDEDGDEEGSVDDEKFSIRDEFNSMMTDIKQGATILETHGDGLRVLGGDGSPADEDRAALYAGVFERLDRSCQWLPAMLVENVPKGKHKFQRFKPVLDILIQHPTCHDFFTWKNSAQGETLLHEAARNNHKGLILYICLQRPEQGKAGLEEKSYNGLTCLHIAAQRQNPDPDLMTLLLAQVGNSGAMIKGTGGNTLLHVAVDIQRCHPGQERVVEILLSAAKDAITEKNDQGLTPLRHHHNTKKATLGYNAAKQNATADQIEMMLRLSCLRLDISRDKTWEILYSNPTERREFTFDLYGYEEIRAEDLENLSGHICLETILKSVVIPDLIVRPPDEFVISPPDPEKPWENGIAAANAGYANGNTADEQLLNEGDDDRASIDIPTGCPGRIDYCWIFKWLRGPAQGVAKIIKLSVKDQKHKSHSDEAIEWCLKHTDVEVLDWNKLDICSTVFTNAAPKVRNLTVYCSGNNAVLRSWLSPEGLVELKDLEVLNLKIVLGLESLQRTTAQARNFKTKYLEQRKQWCQRSTGRSWEVTGNPSRRSRRVKMIRKQKLRNKNGSRAWKSSPRSFGVTGRASKRQKNPISTLLG